MKAVILAGGIGSRLSEETISRPKPMVEIGCKPILWHIMKIYSAHGINDFIICLGYKGYIIKEFFANYLLHMSDIKLDIANNTIEICQKQVEPWRITLVDTGLATATGGRIKKIAHYLDDQPFFLTYGDGVGDVDIKALLAHHHSHKRLVTVTATKPPARFGALATDKERVVGFKEKHHGEGGWINGGFFVLNPEALSYISEDNMPWEAEPLEKLASDNQLSAYYHQGFWHPMDTLRDKSYLDELWMAGTAPWKIWQND